MDLAALLLDQWRNGVGRSQGACRRAGPQAMKRRTPFFSRTVLKFIGRAGLQPLSRMAGSSPATSGQCLRCVEREDAFDRFEFEEHGLLDDDVGDVAG